ncbi:hypothetical protein [Caldithrix abyssi]
MKDKVQRFYLLVMFVIIFSNPVFAGGKWVGFRAGYGSVSFRDVSSSKNWTAVDVSPLALAGQNSYFELSYQLVTEKMVHIFGGSFASANGFQYDSGIRTIERTGDRRNEWSLFYEMKRYLFKQILPRLDAAFGPRVCWGRMNSERYFLPQTKLNFIENQIAAAFVVTLRYSLSTDWHFQAEFANGGLVGFERTKHDQYGWMPERNAINGWISALKISAACFALSEMGFIAYYQRAESVKIGRQFQYVQAENQFGVRLVYRLGGRR